MPTWTATTSQATIRHAVIGDGGYTATVTTTAGTAGGIDLIASSLIGYSEDLIIDRWFLLTSGTYSGQYRRARTFAPATGTVTMANTFGGTVATAVTFEIYQSVHRPDMITSAVNAAIQKLGAGRVPSVYRVVNSYLIANASESGGASGDYYATPRNMRNVFRISHVGSLVVNDEFNRANSTTSPGGSWTAQVGTWGISSERLYWVSGAEEDLVVHPTSLVDGAIFYTVEGTSTQIVGSVFRIRETYLDAIQAVYTGDDLTVRLTATATELYSFPAATPLATSTHTHTDNVDYNIAIVFRGPLIEVWENDVQIISHTLLGTDMKYTQYGRWGFYVDTVSGAAASIDSVYAFSLTTPVEWLDWKQSGDNLTLEIPAIGRVRPTGLLLVEGCSQLTLLAASTTAQTLTTDSTALMEIAATDPAWGKLVKQSQAELAKILSRDLLPNGQLTPQAEGYRRQAKDLEAEAAEMPGMPHPAITAKRGY